jgi:hypothetical protein
MKPIPSAQMAENDDETVVSEGMITEAARAEDLESLTIWARQSVRVATRRPLFHAVGGAFPAVIALLVLELGADVNQTHHGHSPLNIAADKGLLDLVQLLVTDLGADINQKDAYGATPLSVAACRGYLAVVQCLVELGAEVGAVDNVGYTALLLSASYGRYATTKFLVEHWSANIKKGNYAGETVWDMLIEHFEESFKEDEEEDDLAGLIALLRVLVLRDAPPPALLALLSPEPARVVQEGARLRARLPAYLVRRRALLDAHCPVLLPVLR